MKKGTWLPIVVMYLLFVMISFVTNLCNPMAVILKSNFAVSNFAAQLGNAANFIAYAIMGIPSGLLLRKIGYRNTALVAIGVGIIGVFLQYVSGWASVESFTVYLAGAFTAGFCMCMLNTVVNPMLNTLGGGGNRGNLLIQFGGVCSSTAAVLVTILMGSLIADVTKAKIADATPALMIALGVFVFALIVLLVVKIPEPEAGEVQKVRSSEVQKYSAFSFRHFKLGIFVPSFQTRNACYLYVSRHRGGRANLYYAILDYCAYRYYSRFGNQPQYRGYDRGSLLVADARRSSIRRTSSRESI